MSRDVVDLGFRDVGFRELTGSRDSHLGFRD